MHGPSVTLTFPLLSVGMWLKTTLFRLSFTVWIVEVRGFHAPRLDVDPSSAALIRELTETLACPASLPVDLAFGAHHDFGQRPSPRTSWYNSIDLLKQLVICHLLFFKGFEKSLLSFVFSVR